MSALSFDVVIAGLFNYKSDAVSREEEAAVSSPRFRPTDRRRIADRAHMCVCVCRVTLTFYAGQAYVRMDYRFAAR